MEKNDNFQKQAKQLKVIYTKFRSRDNSKNILWTNSLQSLVSAVYRYRF